MNDTTAAAKKPAKKPKLFSFRIKKSPFYEATQRHGCKSYTPYNGVYLPLAFEDIVSDYWSIKKDVTLWDVTCQRQLEITGPDAFKLMQIMTPRNLEKFAIGQCKYVIMTAEDGGILNDPVALRLDENHFWLSLADRDMWSWAKGLAYGMNLDVNITDPELATMAVQGPKSFDLMADLFGDWVRTLKYFWFKDTELNGVPLKVGRLGWSKQGGYEIYLPKSHADRGDELWETIMEAGQKYNIKPASPSSIERVEGGLLNYWEDITEDTNPFEVGLGKICDVDQEVDFVGKEALKKIKAEGVTRQIVGMEIHGEPLSQIAELWPIEHNGKVVGNITSAIYSPDLKKNLAFGMVSIESSEIGTELTIDMGESKPSATVVPQPFNDTHDLVWTGLK